MSMKRFFRAHRDEDYSQIQYLTAKCTRLAHDKAVLDREFLLCRERERKLQNDLEVAASRLILQEQLNVELRMNQHRLISRIHQQQGLVDLLQQRVVLLAEESSRDAELLRLVNSELSCLQSSEAKLEGLVVELHAEAQHRAAETEDLEAELQAEAQHRAVLTESLHAELQSQTMELKELQLANRSLTNELKSLHDTHQEQVRHLQIENEGSLKKLQETAVQFEWLCRQQRSWVRCVKRFKDCLMEEREALQQQLCQLQREVTTLKKSEGPTQSLCCPLQDNHSSDRIMKPADDAVAATDVESDVLYQTESTINRYQKPP
ncbi:unnamed protein product [Ophioblennius macclurei]